MLLLKQAHVGQLLGLLPVGLELGQDDLHLLWAERSGRAHLTSCNVLLAQALHLIGQPQRLPQVNTTSHYTVIGGEAGLQATGHCIKNVVEQLL